MAEEEDDSQILADLERTSKNFDKDAEIDRIMKSFKLNAYDVLDLKPGVSDSDVKMCYRKKSLMIHPDKTSNPVAPDAFDRLQKAHSDLLDEKLRAKLDEAFADARMLIIRENKWTVDSPELKEHDFLNRKWPEKTKAVLIDDELRRRRQNKAELREQGREQRKVEEEMEDRKRKRENDQKWEETREQRIGSWRDFQKGLKAGGQANGTGGEKKKKKMKVLG